jgi:hypothetical protein
VTGMSGAGKTVLFDHLTGVAYHQEYKPPGRSRSLEKGQSPEKGYRIRLNTLPGQESPARLAAITKVFETKRPVDGVIHVVSNGYTGLREPAAIQALISDAKIDTIEKLRQQYLAAELEDLEHSLRLIQTSIRKTRKPRWMIVAVAKADLFYDKLTDAQMYYSPGGNSPFVDKIQRFMSQVGSDNFEWEAMPVATWLEDYVWENEIAVSQLKQDVRDHFVAQFAEVVRKNCGN